MPFNATDISSADRLAIANAVLRAKKRPEVQIQSVVIVGAYKGESNVEMLKETGADNVKTYLQQLGIKSGNILIDKKTFADAMVTKHADGTLTIHQIVVELTPICKGSCAWLCSDPRVTPTRRSSQSLSHPPWQIGASVTLI